MPGVQLLGQAFGIDANSPSAMGPIQTKLQELSALARLHQAAQEPEPPVLAVGDSVFVHGLRGAPQHNGALGVVESGLLGGRHAVALGPGRQAERIRVRPSSLAPVAQNTRLTHSPLRHAGQAGQPSRGLLEAL